MMGYIYLLQDWLSSVVNGTQEGSSIGVWIFKLPAGHIFQAAAYKHDLSYQKHDWSTSTLHIDLQLFEDMVAAAHLYHVETEDFVGYWRYREEAIAAFRLARKWGRVRFQLAKLGLIWGEK